MEFSNINIIDEQLLLIEKSIYEDKLPLANFKMYKAKYNKDFKYDHLSKKQEIKMGDKWEINFDEALFLETSFTIPKELQGKRLVLDLDLGGEGTVYLNNEAKGSIAFYYNPGQSALSGVTRARRRIDVCDKAVPNKKYDVLIELNINYKDYFKSKRFLKYEDNIKESYIFKFANLCSINEEIEKYYFDLKNLIDAIKLLDTPAHLVLDKVQTNKLDLNFDRLLRNMNRDDGLKSKMLDLVILSISKIKFYDDDYKDSFKEASLILNKGLKALPKVERGEVYASGFAHVDLVWLWQIRHTVRKLENTFINAINLIERYPDYIFTFSQPYAFELIEENNPTLFKKIKKYINEGRIDIVGNAYVEMDTNLTGGEAIVRQLLYGRQYYLNKFNKESSIFFMPDSFGFNGQLPQIMKKSGVKYFFTDKLAAFNNSYRFPYTLFNWKGIDGTKIPSYLERCSYNGDLNPERVDETYIRNENKQLNDKAYITFGYGDGGGGSDYVMAENYLRLKDLSGLPKVKMNNISNFFKDAIKDETKLPIWYDELYLDGHRGTYTTHGDIKKYNRKAEIALRQIEIAAYIREKSLKIKYPAKEIKELWKMILPLQFHDGLPGTCISQVYEEFKQIYQDFFKKINKLNKEILDDLTKHIKHNDDEMIVYNFLSWPRKEMLDNNYLLIPSIGYKVAKDELKHDKLIVKDKQIENKYFKLSFDDYGNIKNIELKDIKRKLLKKTSNIFELFNDPACARMSAWDLNKEYKNNSIRIDKGEAKLIFNDGSKAILETTRKFNKSVIKQNIIVYSYLDRIDFKTIVDWHEDNKLLKVAYYPDVITNKATYEIQFGAIDRPTHHNNEYDDIRFEVCGHKWADMSQNDCGIALLNDCKYGYDAYDDTLRLSLLRSPIEPDYKTDRGINEFTYSIYPHKDNWFDANVINKAYELNNPIIVNDTKMVDEKIKINNFVEIDNKNIVLETIKKAEDDESFIFRLFEANGAGGNTCVRLAFKIDEVIMTNLMEKEEKRINVKDNTFTFMAKPFGIYSFKVR